MRYTEDELRSLFQQKFSRKAWTGFLQNFMEGGRLRSVPEEFHTPSDNEKGFFLGEYNTSDHYRIGLFQFDVKAASIARKRVGLRNLVKSLINPNWGEFDAAFAVFASDSDWRLSFICDIKEEKTAPKRFTYVFGEKSLLYRTPVSRLSAIQGSVTFASLKEAFSVEKVSKDFFREYREIYADFVQYLTGNRYVKKTQGSGYELKSFPGEPQNKAFYEALGKDDKRARDFVKKMMGRITFLYFLQQKGWMCGDKNYMFHLFESSSDKDYYLKKVLVPLFFGVLNTKPEERKEVFAKRKWNDELRKAWETIPYLNGGLFEPDEEDMVVDACSTHIFRQKDFEELFEFYSHYNFTIDENDPSDAEVGVDPEMLGKIFESLLEDNKDKGAFYTPKEIVQYMCQESLVAYLVTKTGIEEGRLREFVKEPEENKEGLTEDERYKILDGVLSVKICDPAIGSGAFPIGLLNELVRCKEAIYGDKKGRADIKREIIRDNIYGVDIEKGAVDIARLRFWLSLVVDEDTPSPLPNLDYKIMQGNSLLEWYNGTDLSKLTDMAASDDLFGGGRAEELKKDLAKLLKRYFGESDHDKKFALKEAIKAAITEILDIAGVEIPNEIDIAENNQFFLWHTWYNEVFANNGGFDICIGNPPYINLSKVPHYKKPLSVLYDKIHTGYNDLMYYFLFLGTRIIKNEGISSMITSNYFIGNDYAEKLRLYLSPRIETLVNFKDKKIFEAANIHTCISFLRDKACNLNVECYEYFGDDYPTGVDINDGFNLLSIPREKLGSKWIFTKQSESALVEQLTRMQIHLGDIARIEQGSKSGCNKVFTVPYEFAKNNGFESGVLRINVKNSDIHKYNYSERGSVLIYVDNNTCLDNYPNVKRYLESKREILSKRNEVSLGLYPWYRFDRPRDKSVFDEQEKIIVPYRAEHNRFAYDTKQVFNDGGDIRAIVLKPNSCYSLKFILGILNSTLIDWYFGFIGKSKGTVREYFNAPLSLIPIPSVTKEQQAPIISLVNDILAAKKANPSADTSVQEAEIDRLVYDLYDVPQEERK